MPHRLTIILQMENISWGQIWNDRHALPIYKYERSSHTFSHPARSFWSSPIWWCTSTKVSYPTIERTEGGGNLHKTALLRAIARSLMGAELNDITLVRASLVTTSVFSVSTVNIIYISDFSLIRVRLSDEAFFNGWKWDVTLRHSTS